MNAQEEHIIRRLRQGEKPVITEIYDQYAPALFGVITKIVRSDSLAEDILQETFVKIWRNGPRFDPDRGSLFTWMLNIARHTAIDKVRSAGYRQRQQLQTPLGELPADQADPLAEIRPDHIGLDSMIEGLAEKYRIIIDLIYFQGFTHQEVVEYLDIPLGTVKSRLRIALRELRKLFGEHPVLIFVSLLMIFL